MAYEINININGDISGGGGETEGLSKKKSNSQQEKAQQELKELVASKTIEPFIANVKNQATQNIEIVTGNSELQQRVSFAFEVAQFGNSTFSNVKAGAVIGHKLGIGKDFGALVGLALTAVHTVMSVVFKQEQINLQAKMESYQLEQTRSRFGTAYNRSRSGNGL